ncbi:M28 family peptidase [Fusobacterium ulcerans]|uniref:M28 family peptidase n=1 Tax=Fusobacterium ulcerans TaxID=861 RepID=UPI003CC60F36
MTSFVKKSIISLNQKRKKKIKNNIRFFTTKKEEACLLGSKDYLNLKLNIQGGENNEINA